MRNDQPRFVLVYWDESPRATGNIGYLTPLFDPPDTRVGNVIKFFDTDEALHAAVLPLTTNPKVKIVLAGMMGCEYKYSPEEIVVKLKAESVRRTAVDLG